MPSMPAHKQTDPAKYPGQIINRVPWQMEAPKPPWPRATQRPTKVQTLAHYIALAQAAEDSAFTPS